MNVIPFPELTIKPLQFEDLDEAADFLYQNWQQLYKKHLNDNILKQRTSSFFREYLQRKIGIAWIAWMGKDLAGLLTVSSNCIDDLWVKPSYQRKKIGTKLVEQSIIHFNKRGFTTAQAGCENFNRHAIAFFEAMEWKRIGSQALYATGNGDVDALVYSIKIE
ncbi:MAG: GNAT family N-acetyltransferase [Gammaproteobacteria bacterium]|nr:GNAT family N-acetyltransferase [Gammaproteobacteria bacterium]